MWRKTAEIKDLVKLMECKVSWTASHSRSHSTLLLLFVRINIMVSTKKLIIIDCMSMHRISMTIQSIQLFKNNYLFMNACGSYVLLLESNISTLLPGFAFIDHTHLQKANISFKCHWIFFLSFSTLLYINSSTRQPQGRIISIASQIFSSYC